MKNDVVKNVLRVIVAILAVVCIWTATDKIFSAVNANENIDDLLEILPAGKISAATTNDGRAYVPSAAKNFEMNLRFDNGNEIVKHYDVRGKDENRNIYGYVQVWDTDQTLEHYLKISREYMSANVYGFRESTIKVKGLSCRKWEYIVEDIAVTQAFYEKDGLITICNLCVPYQEKTYTFDKIFIELLESVIA